MLDTYPPDRLFLVMLDSLDGEKQTKVASSVLGYLATGLSLWPATH